MTKNSLEEIRKEFLDFFSNNNHKIVQSSPLVPLNDDSLLFTNAGMVQFKNIFTGIDSPPLSKKATSAQKCVRAGGKHNDLENVGVTKRHHTFFEMLGNFSFGDYFKEDAIELAWNLITKNYEIDANRIIITVYHSDEEALNIWKKITSFHEKKILRINSSDNFWEMGESGPCGPCSEIFFDHGEEFAGGLPGSSNEGDRFVEIWNLVFMQFNKLKNGKRELLPKPSIDTGMGIERVAAVLQGTSDNYEIDLFRNLIEEVKVIFKISEDENTRVSLRVIADHIRSVSFLIADGVTPSNEGRGYVLRRILRRAIRHVYHLGIREPKLNKLVTVLCQQMGQHYKELNSYKDLIIKSIESEEIKFLETLDKGLKILNDEKDKNTKTKLFSGSIAFKLYDTYGFPVDLTADVLKNSNKEINMSEFDKEMQAQKDQSKKSWKGSYDNEDEIIWKKLFSNLNETTFLGYEENALEEKVKKIIVENSETDKLNEKDKKAVLIFNRTPFYAEGGGQIGDTGKIKNNDFIFKVIDTQKRGQNIYAHIGFLQEGQINLNTKAKLLVDINRRRKITAHHSATHLLHSSLRHILGNHVTQKGSLVSESKLRFDISHTQSISTEILNKIEKDINTQIINNHPVKFNICKKDKALEMGAMAIFGEKYEDSVRVVSMGERVDKPFSVELCGGTHVKNTGEIGVFKIISESSLASGIRRIEAVAGFAALELFQKMEKDIKGIADTLKINKSKIIDRVVNILDEKKVLEKEIKKLKIKKEKNLVEETKILQLKNINIYYDIYKDREARELKNQIDNLIYNKKKVIGILISNNKNKVTIVIGVSKDSTENYNAIDLVRHITPFLGGQGGGGKPNLAQGGGVRPDKSNQAMQTLIDYIKK